LPLEDSEESPVRKERGPLAGRRLPAETGPSLCEALGGSRSCTERALGRLKRSRKDQALPMKDEANTDD
jgi:hypothetical protein